MPKRKLAVGPEHRQNASSWRSTDISAQVPHISAAVAPRRCPIHPRPAIFHPLSAQGRPGMLVQRRNLTGQFASLSQREQNFRSTNSPALIRHRLDTPRRQLLLTAYRLHIRYPERIAEYHTQLHELFHPSSTTLPAVDPPHTGTTPVWYPGSVSRGLPPPRPPGCSPQAPLFRLLSLLQHGSAPRSGCTRRKRTPRRLPLCLKNSEATSRRR